VRVLRIGIEGEVSLLLSTIQHYLDFRSVSKEKETKTRNAMAFRNIITVCYYDHVR